MAVLAWRAGDSAHSVQPQGMVAAGPAAVRLLAQLRLADADTLASLKAVATRDLLVVLGPASALPWIDGARYCAPAPQAHTLWLPTHAVPALAADLLQSALRARSAAEPLLLWDSPEYILPLDQAAPLNGAMLDWLEQEMDHHAAAGRA